MTSASVARRFLNVIERSGVLPDLEQRLRTQPGQQSKLSIKTLLLLYFLAAYKGDSARRTDLCSVGNGLDSQVAFLLGLCDRHRWEPLSYVVTRKQSKRFEGALHQGWVAEDGTPRNFTWLVRKLLATSVPNRYLKTIAAVAIDSTANPTWARTREFRLEKDLLAEHRLESLEEPDLPEPDIKPAENPEGKVRTVGSDGRFIRSYDIDARPGYKSATNKEPASLFLGYDAHIAVAVAEAVWSGNPNQVAIKPAPPGYILALHVAPGATNPGPIGLQLALQSLEIAPGIGDFVARPCLQQQTRVVRQASPPNGHQRDHGLHQHRDQQPQVRQSRNKRPTTPRLGRNPVPAVDARIHAHPTRKHQTQKDERVACQPGAVAVDTKPQTRQRRRTVRVLPVRWEGHHQRPNPQPQRRA